MEAASLIAPPKSLVNQAKWNRGMTPLGVIFKDCTLSNYRKLINWSRTDRLRVDGCMGKCHIASAGISPLDANEPDYYHRS